MWLYSPASSRVPQQNVTYSVSPTPFEENQNITLTFNGSSINEATWGVTNNALYLWAWSFDTNNQNNHNSPTNGIWKNGSRMATTSFMECDENASEYPL